MTTKLYATACVAALLLAAQTSFAVGILGPGVHQLHDHGFGDLGPDYGLRNDAINAIFSVDLGGASVSLTWDGGPTATIAGTLYNITTTDLWTVNYVLTGVVPVGTSGFNASAGTGILTDPLLNDTPMTGEQDVNGAVFSFLADGHRIPGDNSSPVGRGWVLPPGSTDDWLVTPEPSTLALLAAGGLMIARRRR